ncbi:PIF1-like helicase [seawater metagenome]|uniref:PIF1-like helicase n=1 Tax=seawater metagenome TaxID=1561972 RepID=A0A5E8CJ54_9ZZZZ
MEEIAKQYIYCNQDFAFNAMLNDNIFLTGPAGSGKSYLIKKYVKFCYSIRKKVAVTALTGSAAYLINGKTLHSWAGIKLGKGTKEELLKLVDSKFKCKMNWKYTDVLIIDEVSMLTRELFEKLDYIGKFIRGNIEEPFGGIQLILTGDFCQLPPITDKENNFCFMSKLWESTITLNLFLNRIYRQTDKSFQSILNKIRLGLKDDIINNILEKCSSKTINKDALIQPTKLFPYKKDVDLINQKHLLKLGNTIITHKIKKQIVYIDQDWSENQIEYLINQMDNSSNYKEKLELAIGAQVMLIRNLDQDAGLINGSRGIITGFQEGTYYPFVEFLSGQKILIEPFEWEYEEENKGVIKRIQIPLILSWCMSIHKSQGLSMDCVKIDIGKKIFEFGQVYVALSRVRNIILTPEEGKNEGLYITSFAMDKIKCHPKVLEYYSRFLMVDDL